MNHERSIVFECEGDRLVGILHEGQQDVATGVIIVVGGPQYRVGSHRQFVTMARWFAAAGVPVLRFDVRGMGDSEGDFPTFEALDADIRAAIDSFIEATQVSGIVLFGLCDAASANLMYGHSDRRVRGLILMNPWVRTERGEAKAYLRHYYVQRLLQRSFWQKVVSGEFALVRSVRELFQSVNVARSSGDDAPGSNAAIRGYFLGRMLTGLKRFKYPVLITISGQDLTAREFMDLYGADREWKSEIRDSRCTIAEYPDADHTMSDDKSLRSMSERCLDWIGNL